MIITRLTHEILARKFRRGFTSSNRDGQGRGRSDSRGTTSGESSSTIGLYAVNLMGCSFSRCYASAFFTQSHPHGAVTRLLSEHAVPARPRDVYNSWYICVSGLYIPGLGKVKTVAVSIGVVQRMHNLCRYWIDGWRILCWHSCEYSRSCVSLCTLP